MANDNKTIGRFDLVGIPPAPRGIPQIDVTFDIDANGIMHVSAKDLGTGKEQSIRITASSGLSEKEIEKLIKEAEAHSEEDKKKKELAEVRNEADGLLYTTERSLSEFGDKIDQKDKSNVEAAIKNLKSAMEGTDVGAIKSATTELTKVSHKLAEAMYSQASAGAAGGEGAEATQPEGTGAESSASGDDVVDADFEEVNDEDKE